jgi:hypothetical protein
MDNRMKGCVLAGGAAALGGITSLPAGHAAAIGDFWMGALIGVRIGMLIMAVLLIRRGSRCGFSNEESYRGKAKW